MNSLAAGLVALGACAATILLLAPIARRFELVDEPCTRKVHAGRIPLVGGIAILVGMTLALLALQEPLGSLRGLFAGALLLVIVGMVDDYSGLPAISRLLIQTVVAVLVTVWDGQVLHSLGSLLGPGSDLRLGVLVMPFTVFCIVGVINAMNLIDGLDGLCGGLVVVALAVLGLACWMGGRPTDAVILMVIGASVLGFLIFNIEHPLRPEPFRVFLGDAGSTMLGLVCAWFLIRLSQGQMQVIAPATALWIIALPLLDTVYVMSRRMLHGRSPFRADRGHLHHLILASGLRSGSAVRVLLLLAAVLAAIGLSMQLAGVDAVWQLACFVGLATIYAVVVTRAWARLQPEDQVDFGRDARRV